MVVSNIGTVSVDFVAEFSRFREDTTKVGRAVQEATTQMAASFKAVKDAVALAETAMATLGIGLAVKEIVDFVEEAVRAGAELKSLSQQAGVSTTTFQVWQFAARSAGTSAEAMTTGISNLTRKIGEAAEGNDDAVKTFTRLGVGVLDAGNSIRPTDDILQQIAEKVANGKTPAEQLRIAYDAFGKSAAQLVPTLAEMGRNSDQVTQKAEDMFQVLGPEAIENLDAMVNGFTIIKNEAMNLAAALAQYLQPVFEKIADALSWANRELRDFLALAADIYKRDIRGDTEVMVRQLQFAPPPSTGPFPNDSQHNPPAANAGASAAKKQADDIKRVTDALTLEYENLGKDSEQQKINTALRQANVAATSAAGQQMIAIIHQGEAYREMLTEMNAEEKAHDDLMKEGRDLMVSLETPVEKFADQMARLDKLYAGGAINIDEYNLAVARTNEAYEAADPEMKKATEANKEFQDSIVSLAGDMGTELVRAFTDAGTAADRFRNLAVHVLQDVLNAVLKLVLASVGGASGGGGGIGDIFTSLLGAVVGGIGGGVAAPAGYTGEIGMNFAGGMHFMAGGGSAGPGDWAIVGEEGPELVRFGQAAQVYPSGFSGGGGANYYIDARGADMGAVARIEMTLKEFHRNFESRAVAAVAGQRKRGGTFATTFSR